MKRTLNLLLFSTLALLGFSGCDTEPYESEVSYSFVWGYPAIVSKTDTGITLSAFYYIDTPSDPTDEAGVRLYSADGETLLGEFYGIIEPTSEGGRFTTHITGDNIASDGKYIACMYARVGEEYYLDPDARLDIDMSGGEGNDDGETGGGEGEGYKISVDAPLASSVTTNSAMLTGTYRFTEGTATVSAAGFFYRKDGSSDWTKVFSTSTASPFTFTINSALEPSTKYNVTTWVEVTDNSGEKTVYESSTTSPATFTTSANPQPPLPSDQPAWAELPIMTEMDGITYVTYYVNASGTASADRNAPGRKRNYTLAYDTKRFQPIWGAAPMHDWYLTGNAGGRNDDWAYSPYIDSSLQPNLSGTYSSNGAPGGNTFNRGHFIASSDRQKSVAMNKQTFYYTNMSPQSQNPFNGGIWNKLEIKVQQWGKESADTLYVVSGALFLDNAYQVKDKPGQKTIPVPSHYYKVLLAPKRGVHTGKSISQMSASELRCVGFYFNHIGHANNATPNATHMKTVSDIEKLTGMNFFPMLSEEAKKVKNDKISSDWGM